MKANNLLMSDIKQYILSLSSQERISLIAFIAASLTETDETSDIDIPSHIVEESREIFKQWDAGQIKGISWKDLKKELKSTYLNG